MVNNKLNETTIGTAKVIVDILPKGKVIPNTKITPTSITIHQTGNIGAPAKNNHNYMKNCNNNGSRIASWHFTVDDKEIYQAQSTNYKCYHAGTTTGNNTSIGIEICMFNDKERQRKAYLNAIELVKVLMAYHKFNINQVKRHKDWSGKHCPAWLIEGKFGYRNKRKAIILTIGCLLECYADTIYWFTHAIHRRIPIVLPNDIAICESV